MSLFGIEPGPYYDEFGDEISWFDYQYDWMTRNNERNLEKIADVLAGNSEPQGAESERGILDSISAWFNGDDPAQASKPGASDGLILVAVGLGLYLVFKD